MESKLARIVKTFTFRLALVYVGLFGLSVILLFAFIYTFAMNYFQGQVSDTIRAQYNYMANDYRENGSAAVEERIKEFIASDDEGTSVYILVNKDYEKVAGNLNEWPDNAIKEKAFEKEGHWVRFYIEGTRNTPQGIEVKAVMIPLSKWRYLLVGQTLQSNEKIEQTIVQAFWASLLLTLVMAFSGAIVMTRSVMKRINVINRSAATIMHGDMTARIPFTRGGDEFDELSSNLNQMLDRIQMLLESLSQFANNIAHDLRSPLNRIINRLDAGLRTIEDENPARKLLEKNIQDMHELIGTFNSILKISELEAGAEFRNFEPCDLQRILENLVEFYEPYAAEKAIALENHMNMPLEIQGEKNLITQAFANLLDNAIKFTPRGGQVTVSCELHEDRTDILIADTGPGVPSEYYDKVFEKFFRLEQSRNTRGNGLGLSLVSAIARIHGATITLEDNAPGLRVRFSIDG
ncbi:MAG: sensor histidine kinase [Alphaproteobacteria bacterium]|nr:sensor histidine kinase [Alphaproteobacteria bacterium]